ncbi:MAG: GTPase HflX [Candidatus Zipacnadales bacterium]
MSKLDDLIIEEPIPAETERAIIVGVGREDGEIARSLAELEALVVTAGAQPVERVVQLRERPHISTFVGKGKLQELEALVLSLDANLVVFDGELSGVQNRNLTDRLLCKVLDRTELILDIFAQRARSREGKLQVELAQLQYTLPRLYGKGKLMSRIGSGMRGTGPIGTRGPGRTKLEVDRSRIQHRMARLRKELEEIAQRRVLNRAARQASALPSISLIGYTNAGKSSLLNALARTEEVTVRDRLFETLDTTTRRLSLGEGKEALISDTVGFVRHLPHHLVAAFRATLEEALEADLLIQVIDASDPDQQKQQEATAEVLASLGATSKPMIYALNKADLVADRRGLEARVADLPNAVATSAITGYGLDHLRALICARLSEPLAAVTLELPYNALHLLNIKAEEGRILEWSYHKDRVLVEAELGAAALGRLKAYVVAEG